jgi:dTDP-4-dehydrorhamnose 3,5-epimerase
VEDSKIFITGANGQLGTALRQQYPNARFADIGELDITEAASVEAFDWSGIEVLINAAAYTNVDGAETSEGRVLAWKIDASALNNLVTTVNKYEMTLVHISTDYVFDGSQAPHVETEPFSPLSIYGASKVAGDLVASMAQKHYILRTSWVIGEGRNFVRTMLDLGKKNVSPTVVADQIGRLTFTGELVRALDHLLRINAAYGTYNITNEGDPVSWAEITHAIFSAAGFDLDVTDTTTAEYFASKTNVAPRPLQSTLDLTKLHSTGFISHDWRSDLEDYIKKELA